MSPHNFGFFANEVYTPTSSRPGGIRAGTSDQNDLFSDMPDKCIRFVSGWFDNNGNQTTQKGQGDVGGEKKALVAWSIMADDTIVHEIGHTLGLSHNDDDTMNIMHGGENDSPPGRDAASNKLTSGEADKFSFTTL